MAGNEAAMSELFLLYASRCFPQNVFKRLSIKLGLFALAADVAAAAVRTGAMTL